MRQGTLLLMLGLMIAAGCSTPLVRQPVDLAPAKCEGVPGDLAWTRAVTVVIPPDATARFIWNEKGVFCRLEGQNSAKDLDEWICVSFGPRASFYLQPRLPGPPSDNNCLVRAVRGDSLADQPLDSSLYRSELTCYMAKVFAFWKAELFVSWEALSQEKGVRPDLRIHAYRISGERPYSFLRLQAGL
jgi:hypothetical protein